MHIPFIDGNDFYLRELKESDLDGNWYSWFNDSMITKYQDKKIFPNSIEKQREYYETLKSGNSDVVFAIVDKETTKHIGNVGLHKIDWIHRSAELGIVVGEVDFHGKKYGKQAWKLITEYGYHTLNLHRIYAIIMSKNIASIKCAESSGFIREGEIRDYFYKNGMYETAYYYNNIFESG